MFNVESLMYFSLNLKLLSLDLRLKKAMFHVATKQN